MAKKTVFITGTTGSMGGAGFNELLQRRDRFNIVTLVLPTKKDRKVISGYLNEPGVKIVWGDGSVSKDILPDGSSERLYFLVADPDTEPLRIVPYYPSVFTPPREDDPWLLDQGEHILDLTIRGENIEPRQIEMVLYIGSGWEELTCNIK